ncbi:SMC family ATPase [Nocardioides sp.]|uniref:SMC family ATPase n=1 Tax=Nocardioides sp. TaxID=35761 RepID=UPI002ED0CED2
MRIHTLEITAFGPFAGEVSIDLDELSDAGLFLLTGATGAGKTSVLDAVCFALYGAVPGDRQLAKRLRSDQAAPGVAPAVRMELTVQGRRFRIRRSPAWQRPKKRGTGLTTEQPQVLVEERTAGSWLPLASRLDEAGHLVSGLLGMTMTQFCQVQLLPQGRFQEFLRAESDDRRRLLQRLFRTSRFEDVERWLREHRRELRRQSANHHDRVADLVSRLSEVATTPLPAAWDLTALDEAVEELQPWASRLRLEAEETAADDEARAASAESAAAAAARALEAGRSLAAQRRRLAAARRERSALVAEIPAHRGRVARLDAARRAAAVLPACEVATRVAADLQEAERRADAARAALRDLDGTDPAYDDLGRHAREVTERAARVRALAPRANERERLEGLVSEAHRAIAAIDSEAAEVGARLDELPAELAARRTAETEARRAVDGLDATRAEAAVADQRLAAARHVVTLVAARAEAEIDHRLAVDEAQQRREEWLTIQEQRISGMAAEIAGALAVGACCPVCGSADHPSLARPAPGAPDAAAERAARKAVDDAEAVRHAHTVALSDLDAQIALARDRSGNRSVGELEQEAGSVADRLKQLEARASGLDQAVSGREHIEQEQARLVSCKAELTTARARHETMAAEHAARITEIAVEIAGVLEGTGHDSVADLAHHLDAVAKACADLDRVEAEVTRARGAAQREQARALGACLDHGFDSVAAARGAELPPQVVDELTESVNEREARLVAVETALADPDLQPARQADAPSLDALEQSQRKLASELAAARAALSVSRGRVGRLATLCGKLAAALAAWSPTRESLEVADRMATLVDGTSPDNRLRMRLSGYVLAFRLRQVVAAANERLLAMTDHRYRLEHSDDRGAGESRGGLSLRVRDDWSGESRDPVTLSGGETFVVSLALALGLADVIAHEAGGSELDTLFVDEGFGTLDADTLDDVMDTLDSLRDGGRVVGVVSHVAELRDRIPTQLHVHKHRSGSTVHQEAAG